jgi:hypothetical protein
LLQTLRNGFFTEKHSIHHHKAGGTLFFLPCSNPFNCYEKVLISFYLCYTFRVSNWETKLIYLAHLAYSSRGYRVRIVPNNLKHTLYLPNYTAEKHVIPCEPHPSASSYLWPKNCSVWENPWLPMWKVICSCCWKEMIGSFEFRK